MRAQWALTTKGTTVKINRRPLRLALALTAATAVVLGAGVSGAAASNGAERSSSRSQEAHEENGHPNPDAVRGHDEDDNPGRGRGHEDHGNGHGYGHDDHTHQSEPSGSNPNPGDDAGDDSGDDAGDDAGAISDDSPSTGSVGSDQPAMNDSVDLDPVGQTPTPRGVQDAGSTTQSQVAVLDADLTDAVLDQITAADPDGLVAVVSVVEGGQVVRLVATGSFGGAILRAH